MTIRLSAVLIARDEEARLPKCLPSLAEFDEIVLHDTGSSDRTLEVARAFPNVIAFGTERREPFHFADARNLALDRATHDWIVSIDADEHLVQGSVVLIRRAIEDGDGRYAGYKLWFRFDPGRCEYPRFVVFQRSRWRWRNRVHNTLEPIGAASETPLIEGAVIEHFEPAGERRKWREEQTFELLKIEVAENPEHVRAWRHLGLEYFLRKDWAETIRCLKRYLAASQDSDLDRMKMAVKIARAHEELGRLEDALEWHRKAARMLPEHREPYWEAARALLSMGRWREAMPLLDRCLDIPRAKRPEDPFGNAEPWGDLPERALAWCRDRAASGGAKS